ncbi:MAG: FeoB small GTPase domain-containing protein [Calothrix sp. MO_192.B10]|nr:FeoB small GTPase domain-containing protein [Calothrix sp. MO_192.B10]
MSCHDCPSKCQAKSGKSSRIWDFLGIKQRQPLKRAETQGVIALVGMPNVGKSVLFNALTGKYVAVSNYSGTTVEIAEGIMAWEESPLAVIDTPGMYSFLPISEEEKVARDLLLNQAINLVVHVVDGKNLGRMLPLTFQLIEAGFPVLLAINMIDEAEQQGMKVNSQHLQMELGIPVVVMSATTGRGIKQLKARIGEYVNQSTCLSPTY